VDKMPIGLRLNYQVSAHHGARPTDSRRSPAMTSKHFVRLAKLNLAPLKK
jgi:hypothetical protein